MSSAKLREWSDWANTLAEQIDDDPEVFASLSDDSKNAFQLAFKLLVLAADNLRMCAELEEIECGQPTT